jgi:hypothetical protein
MAIPRVKLVTAVSLAVVVTAIVYCGERSSARHAERVYGMPPPRGPGPLSYVKWFLITFGTTYAVLHFFMRPGKGGGKGSGSGVRDVPTAMSGGGGGGGGGGGSELEAYTEMLMNIDMKPPPF